MGNENLFIFVTHLFAKLSVFVFGNLFSSFLYNRTHSASPPFINHVLILNSVYGVNNYFKFT